MDFHPRVLAVQPLVPGCFHVLFGLLAALSALPSVLVEKVPPSWDPAVMPRSLP